MAILTEAKARAIKPGDKKISDGTVKGLWLLANDKNKGTGYWIYRYTSPTTRKRREMSLGVYPIVGIADARSKAHEAVRMVKAHQDPLEVRENKDSAASTRKIMTFEAATRRLYEQRHPGWKNGKHRDQWITTMEKYVFPSIGSRNVETLGPDDFQALLLPIWSEKEETATRVKQRCHMVIEWCLALKLVSSNPVSVVHHLLPPMKGKRIRTSHHPSVQWADISNFVKTLLRDGSEGTCREAIEAVVLTGARSGEVRKMCWDQIDFEEKVWNVPAQNMKNQVMHRVPLSWRMIELLKEQKEKGAHPALVFPSPTGKVMSDNTMSKLLRDHKVKSDNPDRYATVHGFRATLRTWGEDHGYSRELMKKIISHTESNILDATYARTDKLELRRPIMEAWADFVYGVTRTKSEQPN